MKIKRAKHLARARTDKALKDLKEGKNVSSSRKNTYI